MSAETRPLAVVTGASSGIGLEFAKLLAADGYDLVLIARSKSELERQAKELKREYGASARIAAADLSDSAQIDYVLKMISGQPVDILVNSAGFGTYGRFDQLAWAKESDMMQLNMTALTRLCKAVLPGMLERDKGKIINVASLAAFLPGPYMAVYYATKAYILSLSEALYGELDGTGVVVTALCPGPTASGFSAAAGAEKSKPFSRPLPSAASVARYGYVAMKRGQMVAVPGWRNQLVSQAVGLLPRRMVVRLVKRSQQPD